jgi:pyruvate dehydrogenase E1 component
MAPFFTFYSMFGFQRVGDLLWAAADARARGFLLGATAGRTTLAGEGLQHQDGHSLLLASAIPTCRAYDPAFAYELAAIVRAGIRAMIADEQDGFWYLTLYNEPYAMPAQPDHVSDDDIVGGMSRWLGPPRGLDTDVTLLFSGALWSSAHAARDALANRGIGAELWSVTSWKALRDDALAVDRWNQRHPTSPPRTPRVTSALAGADGPVVAVSDWVRAVPDLLAPFIPAGRAFRSLGTDGFGRSDTRAALRRFFEVDADHVELAVLGELARTGRVDEATLVAAHEGHGIDPELAPPWTR